MILKLFIYLLSNSPSQQLIFPPFLCNFLFLLLSRVNWKKMSFSDLNKGSEGSLFFNYIKIIYLFIYLFIYFRIPSLSPLLCIFGAFLALNFSSPPPSPPCNQKNKLVHSSFLLFLLPLPLIDWRKASLKDLPRFQWYQNYLFIYLFTFEFLPFPLLSFSHNRTNRREKSREEKRDSSFFVWGVWRDVVKGVRVRARPRTERDQYLEYLWKSCRGAGRRLWLPLSW